MTPQQPCEFVHLATTYKPQQEQAERYINVALLDNIEVDKGRTAVYVLKLECWIFGAQAASLLRYLEQHSGDW